AHTHTRTHTHPHIQSPRPVRGRAPQSRHLTLASSRMLMYAGVRRERGLVRHSDTHTHTHIHTHKYQHTEGYNTFSSVLELCFPHICKDFKHLFFILVHTEPSAREVLMHLVH